MNFGFGLAAGFFLTLLLVYVSGAANTNSIMAELKDWQTALAGLGVLVTYLIFRDSEERKDRVDLNQVAAVATEVRLLGLELATVLKLIETGDTVEANKRLSSLPEPRTFAPENTAFFNLPQEFIHEVIEFHYAVDDIGDRFAGTIGTGVKADDPRTVARLGARIEETIGQANQVLKVARRALGRPAAKLGDIVR